MKTKKAYLDDNNNFVPEEDATRIAITKYNKKGKLISETWLLKKR